MTHNILVINPGSTSTKLAVYRDDRPLFTRTVDHSEQELAPFAEIRDQYPLRLQTLRQTLDEEQVDIHTLTAVVARGGLLPPVKAGAYRVNDRMVERLLHNPVQEHAANLGAALARAVADEIGVDAYIYDPVTVDEMDDIHRVSGLPGMQRRSMVHTLNMRACAMRHAADVGKPYRKLTLIVAHLGGGITLTLHQGGRMTDAVSDEEGPFSSDRSGGLPLYQVIELATSGRYDLKEMMKLVRRKAGMLAYLGTGDARTVEQRAVNGDEAAAFIYEAMAMRVAKDIGKLAVVPCGKVDAIILTGGIARSKLFTDWVTEHVRFIAPVVLMPGENEMQSLAQGALRVLRGEEQAHEYDHD